MLIKVINIPLLRSHLRLQMRQVLNDLAKAFRFFCDLVSFQSQIIITHKSQMTNSPEQP